jgi:eukaryotic translation initiation factor 2C
VLTLKAALGIEVDPKLIVVPGRVLTSPNVRYSDGAAAYLRSGSWNMNNVKFTSETTLSNWTYLLISAQGSRDPWDNPASLERTIDGLTVTLRKFGVNASPCIRGRRIAVNPGSPEEDIDQVIHEFTSTPEKVPPKLILVILPFMNSAIFNRVKLTCDVKEGILCVCVLASKFAAAKEQYHANVALKFNLKLGGQNQSLGNQDLGVIAEGKTMVVGLDVTHPAPGSSSKAPSVAGIVASINANLGQWPADLRIQTGRQEMVADLSSLFKSRLKLWQKHNGALPENVLLYRDGVSEGQYNIVLEQELPALREVSHELYSASMQEQGLPHLTIVIVGKRHNTRFYPTNKENADRSSNPQNGTIVDRGVTEARNWDFFLQAHTALQGTARPAHYYIIYDEIFRSRRIPPHFTTVADVLEDLTHKMCYLFGRATKSVSICPPDYYADILCERARCYLGGIMNLSSSPGGSVLSGQTGQSSQIVDQSLVRVHENVKDAMFYI